MRKPKHRSYYESTKDLTGEPRGVFSVFTGEKIPRKYIALNAVYDYCEMWQLTVNTEKTKVVIFSRAKVQNFPAFLYGHKHIEVVDDYVYLGCTFNYNGNFHKAIAKQVSQAKKAYYSLMEKTIKFKLRST